MEESSVVCPMCQAERLIRPSGLCLTCEHVSPCYGGDKRLTPDEKNLHGAIAAMFITGHAEPSIEEVIDMIERRFGIAPEAAGKITTRETLAQLAAGLTDAMTHLRPDTIDWFKSRVQWLIAQAEVRNAIT